MNDAPESLAKPNRQWRVIAAIFAALTLAIVGWYFLVLRDDKTVIYRDLRPADASALAADLTQHGLHARVSADGRDISTPSTEADAARQVTAADPIATGVQGFELFDQAEMGLNEFDEKIRYQRALQGELERTLMGMEGVVSARVHISAPDRSLFRSEQMPAAAAVTLVTRASDGETPARVEGVQRLVAAAVTGLAAANVVVLNGRGEIISPRVSISSQPSAPASSDEAVSEHAADALRAALPDRHFEIAISEDSAAAAPAAPGAHAVVSRVITVSTDSALTVSERDRVSAQLRQAGLVDASGAQKIVFDINAPDQVAVTPPAVTPSTNNRAAAALAWPVWIWATLACLIAGVLAAGLLFWRRTQPRLSDEQQEDFAARLRAALQAPGGDNELA